MRVLFTNREYGQIEVTQEPGKEGQAYFKQDDYEAVVAKDGSFKNMYGGLFRVFWLSTFSQDAILEATFTRQIARATIVDI